MLRLQKKQHGTLTNSHWMSKPLLHLPRGKLRNLRSPEAGVHEVRAQRPQSSLLSVKL